MNKQEIESGYFRFGKDHEMNKQEIEKAIEVLKRKSTIPNDGEKFSEIEKSYDIAIDILTQQLNNGWIPITPETNPKKSDIYLATFEENGNRYVERFYYSVISGWMMPVHWQDEGHIDKMLFWREFPEACEEVSQ